MLHFLFTPAPPHAKFDVTVDPRLNSRLNQAEPLNSSPLMAAVHWPAIIDGPCRKMTICSLLVCLSKATKSSRFVVLISESPGFGYWIPPLECGPLECDPTVRLQRIPSGICRSRQAPLIAAVCKEAKATMVYFLSATA